MRLHVVDGTYELFRAHFTKRPGHTDAAGQPVKATVGFATSMLALLADEQEAVTHIAIAFDRPIRSFRNDLFDDYKCDDGIDPELYAQFEGAEAAAKALGIVVWSMDRWEADDALATAAARWRSDVDQVRILTPDKDLGQCLAGAQVVQVDRMRKKVIDEAAFRERRGIAPESVPDYLALVGDSADGIPGLPGFGEKSTAKLLSKYVRLDRIPDDPTEWDVTVRGAARLAATLSERREDAKLYRTLATLITDVPLAESLADLEWAGAPQDEFLSWCDEMALPRLRDRPTRWR